MYISTKRLYLVFKVIFGIFLIAATTWHVFVLMCFLLNVPAIVSACGIFQIYIIGVAVAHVAVLFSEMTMAVSIIRRSLSDFFSTLTSLYVLSWLVFGLLSYYTKSFDCGMPNAYYDYITGSFVALTINFITSAVLLKGGNVLVHRINSNIAHEERRIQSELAKNSAIPERSRFRHAIPSVFTIDRTGTHRPYYELDDLEHLVGGDTIRH